MRAVCRYSWPAPTAGREAALSNTIAEARPFELHTSCRPTRSSSLTRSRFWGTLSWKSCCGCHLREIDSVEGSYRPQPDALTWGNWGDNQSRRSASVRSLKYANCQIGSTPIPLPRRENECFPRKKLVYYCRTWKTINGPLNAWELIVR